MPNFAQAVPTCPSRNKVDFAKISQFGDKNRPYGLDGQRWQTKNGGGGIQNQKQEPHTKMWGKNVEAKFCPGSCPPARQEIRLIFAKISLILTKMDLIF